MHVINACYKSMGTYKYRFTGQDKGGPSKGGFMNDRLLTYTDLYNNCE